MASREPQSYFYFEEARREITISNDIDGKELEKLISSVDEADDTFWVNALQIGCVKGIDSEFVLKAFNKYKNSTTSRSEVVGVAKALLLATYQDDTWVEIATSI